MAELMLRGPQTLAELRSRASRMTHLESQDYARDLLAELERTDPPLVCELEREPGKSARRFGQLLGGEISPERAATSTVDAVAPTVITRQSELLGGRTDLEERVERLEATVAELREDLNRLRVIINEE